jgi:prefoldin subunit 5
MVQKKSAKPQKATLDKILSTVERGFAAVAEDIADIKSKMVTKTEFNEAAEKLDDRLTAVESKIGGIHNRIDDEALKRANLETRVRSAVPNLPPPPERV